MYKCIVHDRIMRVTAAIEANTFEEAARKYFDATSTPHHTDDWLNKHWEVEVMGIKFHKVKNKFGEVTITRVTDKPTVVEHIKLILPAWLRN